MNKLRMHEDSAEFYYRSETAAEALDAWQNNRAAYLGHAKKDFGVEIHERESMN